MVQIIKERNKKERKVNFKVTEEDLAIMRSNANVFAKGNLSLWVRHAAIHWRPGKTDKKKAK